MAHPCGAFAASAPVTRAPPRISLPARRLRPRACAAPSRVDVAHMRRCIALAQQGRGQTRPNPMVGCVLTDAAGEVVAEGYHTRAGRRHAEAEALHAAAAAGRDVEGGTAYVSLEPCNHTGRTPPCSEALVRSRVKRVVLGMVDPDPRTAGGGVETMRRGGVEVVVGVERAACERLSEGFVRRIVEKAPLGVLKYAMTLDGKIATVTGASRWVTGSAARARVHEVRSGVDAIVVGGGTVRRDDPSLTVRLGERGGEWADGYGEPPLRPLRVVMSRSMDLPADARLWDGADGARTAVLTAPGHGEQALVGRLRARGVQVVEVPGLRPRDAMDFLYEEGALEVLWECGGGLAAAAVKDGCVQKVHAFVAPKFVGGGAVTPMGEPALATDMGEALVLRDRSVEVFDGDILVSGYL